MPTTRTLSEVRKHKVASREDWLKERVDLLKSEKELTRLGDVVTRKRQELPWVKIDKDYQFETGEGKISLAGLFKGCSQLLIYHFMFGPDYTAGCPHCSAIADGFNGIWTHLANHDVMLWAVSRAPFPKLESYKKRMGWTFPWASSYRSDFNYDFNVSFTREQVISGNRDYNYNKGNVNAKQSNIDINDRVPEDEKKIASDAGTEWEAYAQEAPGISAFVVENGTVYHTYSSYARGLDSLWGMYQWLDRAPYGRNETGFWMRRHDEYSLQPQDKNSNSCCG